MEEIWKTVKGFEELYEISSIGRLRSKGRFSVKGRYYPPHVYSINNRKGWYLTTILRDGKRHITKRIHRLVYEAFVGNIPDGYDVHHIDGNKQNNKLENLQLISENEHMHLHGIQPKTYYAMNEYNFNRRRKVCQYTLDGEFIKLYSCAHEASLETGVCERNILQVACHTPWKPNKFRKQAGGFIWKLYDTTH